MSEHLSETGKVYHVRDGEGWVHLAGRELVLRPGHLYLIPESMPLSYGCRSRMSLDWIHFRGIDGAGRNVFQTLSLRHEVQLPVNGERSSSFLPIETIMRHLVQSAVHSEGCRGGLSLADCRDTLDGARDVGGRLEHSGLIQAMVSLFVVNVPPAADETRCRLLPAVVYANTHIGESVSVGTLASVVALERSHFTRLFTRTYGVSPGRYMQHLRIKHARLLLRSTDCTVAEIAERLGYSDGSHLWRDFRKTTGLSPRAYREAPTGP